jgi:hypothetical protein
MFHLVFSKKISFFLMLFLFISCQDESANDSVDDLVDDLKPLKINDISTKNPTSLEISKSSLSFKSQLPMKPLVLIDKDFNSLAQLNEQFKEKLYQTLSFSPQLPKDPTISPNHDTLYEGELLGVYPFGLKEYLLVSPTALIVQTADLQIHPVRWNQAMLELPIDLPRAPRSPQKIINTGHLSYQGHILKWIAFEDGLWTYDEQLKKWQASPLNADIQGLKSMIWAKNALWWIDSQGLSRWYQDQVQRFNLDLQSDALLYARKVIIDAEGHLPSNPGNHYDFWLKNGNQMIGFSGLDLFEHPSWQATNISISQDGIWFHDQLRRIWGGADGSPWRTQPIGILIDALWSHPNQELVWALSGERLWLIKDQRAISIDFEGHWRGAFCDEAGNLNLWGADGLKSISLSKRMRINAPSPNVPIGPTTAQIEILPDVPETLSSLSIQINPNQAQSITHTLNLSEISFPYRFEINPLDYPAGVQNYLISASYQDGEQIDAFGRFSIAMPIRFSTQIEPIFEEKCARCHDQRGGARILETAQNWQNQYDVILRAVVEQRMPIGLSPLEESEITLIESWRNWGYLE